MPEITDNIIIDPKKEQILSAVKSIPVFSGLDEKAFDSIAGAAETKRLKLGESLFRKDTPVDKFCYMLNGSVRKKMHIDGTVQSLGKFEKGSFFGLLSFFDNYNWEFDLASSDSQCTLIEIDPNKIDKKSLVGKISDKIAYYRLKDYLETIFACASIPSDYFYELSQEIFIRKVKSGDYLFSQGDPDNSLYLVINGQFELYRENAEVKGLIGTVKKDGFLGEFGALTGKAQGYDAKAVGDSTIIEIPYDQVKYILQNNLIVSEEFNKQVKAYEAELDKLTGNAADSGSKSIYPEFLDTGEKKIRKFPWLHQHDESDCGAACLTMISKFYGLKLSMGQVREMANVSVEGATMGAVCRAAENLGFRARPYKLSYDGLKNLVMPSIIHWQGYHWVVIFRISDKFVWLADPAIGIRKLSHEEFRKNWTRYTIELETTEMLKDIKPAKNPIMRFVQYLVPYKFFFFEIFIGSLVLNMLGLASPLFIQSIIDNVIIYKNVSLLNMMLFGMVLVTFFSTLTSSIQNLVMIYVTTRLDLKLLADFYKHILSLPMKFFYSRKTGDIITRFGENTKVRAILSGTAITTVLNVIMVVVYLSMMFAYSSNLSLVVLGFLPLFIAMTFIFTPIIKRISNDIFMSNSEQSSIMIESIQGIETIKANSIEWNVRTKWEDSYVNNVNLSAKMQRIQMLAGILSQTIGTASSIVLLWYGAHLVMAGSMSIGEFMGFNTIVGCVMGPIMGLISLYDQFQNVTTSMERINDVLEMEPEEAPPTSNDKPKIFVKSAKGDIVFDNVSFRYGSEDSPLIINCLNLEIPAGKTYAFVGKSGCGKSTLIKMVAGFNLPTGGSLLIDGYDIKNTDIYSLRKNIGWVLQDSFLFSGTVSDNIALGDTNPDPDLVKKAADLAAAHEFIKDFPMGYKTMIGEKGMAVSGGQRQRICIARALYRDPRIILMDEATSALDAQSEKRIQENLDNLLKGRTAIIIAHRLSTVRNADAICYLDAGRIVEKGSHNELMKLGGLYYAMASEQLGSD